MRISIWVIICLSAQAVAVFDFSVWNNPTCSAQCHGDADCQGALGEVRVTTADLSILMATYGGSWPTSYPDLRYNPQADFDRNFRIDEGDEIIIEEWLNKRNVPQDCGKKLELVFDRGYVAGGSTQFIQWKWNIFTDYIPLPPHQDSPCSYSFALYYAYPGSGWVFIGTGTCRGPIPWQVPNINMQDCRLRIADIDHPGLEDYSATFTIYECQLDPEMDSDGDCVITIKDFSYLATNWLIEPDGKNIDDLLLLADYWLACGNPYDPECIIMGE
ncbi:MAG: hypothetical protein L0Y36_04195 [Planctomycetales bacterium]|nr:hypothetical protein [Planctomycetales bacterium]